MKNKSPAVIAGLFALIIAVPAFLIHPLLTIVLLLFFIGLCILGCFFPGTNFLGPVISRGCTKGKKVALTFDDGPSPATTPKILDLLDLYEMKATFFVSGVNSLQYPDLIHEIIRRGHSVGNHSYSHDPFLMLKSHDRLYREVYDAQDVLRKLGIDTLAFRPPVGIINPKLPAILTKLGLLCVTFSCRAYDAGNLHVRNLAGRILKKMQGDDIILLHDQPPRRRKDDLIFWREIENILTGIKALGLRVVPLDELIGKEIMKIIPPSGKSLTGCRIQQGNLTR